MGIIYKIKKILGFKEKSYKNIFHIDNWRKETVEEKIKALQKLEEEYAKKQGRKPCEVKAEKLPEFNSCGGFIKEDRTIVVNREFLEFRPDQRFFNYMSVDTVIHEGIHSYQCDAAEGLIENIDSEFVRKAKENLSVYFGPEKGYLYRFQFIERYAYENAYQETLKIFKELEHIIGVNPNFEKYLKIMDRETRRYSDDAMEVHGNNYEDFIDKMVSRKHQEKENFRRSLRIDTDKIIKQYSNEFCAIKKLSKEAIEMIGKINIEEGWSLSLKEIKERYIVMGKSLENNFDSSLYKKFSEFGVVIGEIRSAGLKEIQDVSKEKMVDKIVEKGKTL